MEETRIDHLSDLDMRVDTAAARSIDEAGKWAKFIAIVALICTGLFLLLFLIGIDKLGTLNRIYPFLGELIDKGEVIFIVILLIIAAIAGVLFYFLLNFGQKSRQAVYAEQSDLLAKSYRSLKLYFIISTIIALLLLFFSISTLTNEF